MEKGEKKIFKNIDEYIAGQPENLREDLELIRETIKRAAPDATETISYQMPGFKYHGVLVWFAVNKNHIGFYVRPQVKNLFAGQLEGFTTTKSAIHLPIGKPIPVELIYDIARHTAESNLQSAQLKTAARRKKK